MREDAELRENRLVEDVRRKMEDDKSRKLKEQEARSKFDNERKRVQEALKLNETIAQKLKEVEPSMTQVRDCLILRTVSHLRTCATAPHAALRL